MATITDKAMQGRAKAADIWLTDSTSRGAGALVGRITPAGERLFYFRHTDSTGARRLMPIGPYHPKGATGLTLVQARDRARDLSTLYRSGIKDLREHFKQQDEDRRRAEDAARAAIATEQRQLQEAEAAAARRVTVRGLFEQWRTADLQPHTRADGRRLGRKDGGQYVAEQFGRHVFPTIGDMPLEDVRKADLLALLDAQKVAGKARTANVLLTDLKQMLDFAAERELIASNPLARVKRSKIGGASVERDRHLSDDEIKQLATALPTARMHPRSEAAVWLVLATAARIGEAMGAVWADALPGETMARQRRIAELRKTADAAGVKVGIVDAAARTWYLPDTKNQRDHTIHLSNFALAKLERLAALREMLPTDGKPSPWVFPATDPTMPVCVKSLGKQLADRQREPDRRMSHRAKGTDALMLPGGRWTMHDLRRTASTFMTRLGFRSDVVDECLNHMQAGRMARVYIHDRREAEQMLAFVALGQRLEELVRGEAASAKVVPIRAA
ncbi:MAG: tyrosine-type recombinase/integrase [Burkholderiales bacterium]|nr:tyrosine-type recombinase/integrase [Burkholderiales bacterium]